MIRNTLPGNSLIIDSGFWLALANRRDKYHEEAIQALNQFESLLFITTWPVIIEASHLIYKRVHYDAQMLFLNSIAQGGVDIFNLDQPDHWGRILELIQQYRDLPMDLADASLVILAEELGHGQILSTDLRDFRTYRWKYHDPFEKLLLPEL